MLSFQCHARTFSPEHDLSSPVLEETIKMSLTTICFERMNGTYISLLCSIETWIAILFTTVMIFINVENISLNSSSFKICSFSHNSLSLCTLSSQCWSSSSWPRLTGRWPWRGPSAGVADRPRSRRCLSARPSRQSFLWSERTGSPRKLRASLSQCPWSWLCPESWWRRHVGDDNSQCLNIYLTISCAQPESTMKSMTQGMTPSTLDRTSNINSHN